MKLNLFIILSYHQPRRLLRILVNHTTTVKTPFFCSYVKHKGKQLIYLLDLRKELWSVVNCQKTQVMIEEIDPQLNFINCGNCGNAPFTLQLKKRIQYLRYSFSRKRPISIVHGNLAKVED